MTIVVLDASCVTADCSCATVDTFTIAPDGIGSAGAGVAGRASGQAGTMARGTATSNSSLRRVVAFRESVGNVTIQKKPLSGPASGSSHVCGAAASAKARNAPYAFVSGNRHRFENLKSRELRCDSTRAFLAGLRGE